MDAAYIKSTVSAAVIEGLSALAKVCPEDPVDYLGKWLIKHSEYIEQVEKQQKAAATSAEHYSSSSSKDQEEKKGDEAAAAGTVSESTLQQLLSTCAEVDDSVLQTFANGLQQLIGATGVYVAEKVGASSSSEGEAGSSGSVIKYITASSDHEFMLQNNIREGEGGVTWKCWVMPEPIEDAPAEEEGEESGKPKPVPTLPTIHIANILRDSDVFFHRLPKPGAFVAVPLEYGTLVHENALPAISLDEPSAQADAEEKGGEEGKGEEGEGEEGRGEEAPKAAHPAFPPGNTIKRSLALCADTLGQNRDFTAEQLALLQRLTDAMKAAITRTEQAAYEEEYTAAKQALLTGGDAAAAAAEKEKEALAGADSEATAAIEALGENAAEEYKAYIKSSSALKAARILLDERISYIAEIQRRRIQPKADGIKLLQSIWYMLGYTKEQLGDPYSADAKAFDWNSARKHLGAEFVRKLKEYDPEAVQKVNKYQSVEAIRGVVSGLASDELNKQSVAFGALLNYANAALDLREAAVAKRRKEAEDEAERKRKQEEEEAAAKAAAEEEAAKKAAEESNGAAEGGEGEGEGEAEQS